jgi:hypothetical protein
MAAINTSCPQEDELAQCEPKTILVTQVMRGDICFVASEYGALWFG